MSYNTQYTHNTVYFTDPISYILVYLSSKTLIHIWPDALQYLLKRQVPGLAVTLMAWALWLVLPGHHLSGSVKQEGSLHWEQCHRMSPKAQLWGTGSRCTMQYIQSTAIIIWLSMYIPEIQDCVMSSSKVSSVSLKVWWNKLPVSQAPGLGRRFGEIKAPYYYTSYKSD